MRLRAFIAGLMLAMTFGLAQAQPSWSTVPSIVSVGPLGVTVRFGIDVPGTVYIIVFNSNVTTALTSTYVRNAAIAGPSGGMVATAVITVTAGQANMTLQQYFDLVNAARTHALYIVAANASGTLQADPVRLGFTTLACPSVKLKTYFGNLGECVNLGAVGYFSASPMPATPTGVLKGTVWTIDWGDGTTWSYTSTADGDIPVDQFHTFTTITDCNYVGVWTIQNPCGEFSNGSSVFVVHGREIPDDGDGDIRMQEPVSGDFDITYVCEGRETNLVVRDETTWNCQDPEVPAPLTAIPNTSNRNIQFVYGETPAGAIMNTITGDVLIGGTNTANSANGYIGPVLGAFAPPNPNTVSDVITIPSTANAGERFYVYLKYWNKCNPLVDENLDYVDDFFIIEVVEAPDPPQVVSPQTYCFGNVPATVTATPNTAGNTINWYSDAALTNLLHTGATYTHGITGPGTFTLYATEVIGTGGCEGPAAPLVLIITPGVDDNTISADQTICYNTVPAVMTGLVPSGGSGAYAYLWQRSTSSATSGFSDAPGVNNGQNYTPPAALTTTSWYRRVVTSGLCTDYSNVIKVTVYSAFNAGTVKSAQSICYNTEPDDLTVATAPSGGSGTYTYQWQQSSDNVGWSDIGSATSSTYSPPALTASTYYRRIVTDSQCGSLPTPSVLITVYGDLTAGQIGSDQTICYNTAPATITNTASPTGGDGTYYYRWYRSTNGTSWQQISGASSASYSPGSLTVTTWYRRRVTNTCGTEYTASVLITVLGPVTAGSVGSPQTICYNTAPATLTELTAPTGGIGTYTYQWQSSPNNSTWTGITGANSSTYSPGALTATTYFRRVVTSGTCGSANSGSVLITVRAQLTPGTVGPAQSICYNTAPATLTQLTAPTGGTGTYTYQWERSTDNISWTTITGATSSSYSPGVLTVSTYYRRNVTSGVCGTVNGTAVLITVYGDLTPGSIGSPQMICYNTAPATLTQTTAPGGGSGVYTYQWQRSTDNATWNDISGATSATYTPGALTVPMYFRRNVTSSTCGTVSSNSVLISLYSTLTLAQLNSDISICNNTSTTFYVDITGGTPPYTVNYTRNGSAQTALTNYTSGTTVSTGNLTTGTYVYELTGVTDSHGCQAQSLGSTITVSVGTAPTAATFTGSGDLCFNTPAYLTSVITGGGAPYKLTITGLATSPVTNYYSGDNIDLGVLAPGTYTYTLTRVDDNCGQTLSAGLPISHTFTVFGPLDGGSIGSSQTICYNTLPAPFTNVTAPSGGTALTYQWQKSPAGANSWADITGANSLAYAVSANLTASTDYRRVTTSGNGCGTVYSNVITVTVYGNLTPGSVGTSQSICFNTAPAGLTELTAPTGGTGTYTYQWQSSIDNVNWNPIGGANSATYGPGALTVSTWFRRNVTCGTCGTVSSTPVLITVYGDLTPGTIGSDQSICYNSAPATLTSLSAPAGGTGTYVYQWQISSNNVNWFDLGGATSASYTPGVLTNDRYYRRNVTSGTCGTVSSAPVHIIVYANLLPGAIGTSQTICYNTVPAALTEFGAPTGGTGTYTYQWQTSSDNVNWFNLTGANTSTYAPGALTATTWFRRAVTSGTCGTVYSGNVLITVYPELTPGSVGTAQSICYNTIPAPLTETAAPQGGTGTYSYQWQRSTDNVNWTGIGGATSATYSPGALTVSTWFRRSVTSGTCGTVNSAPVLITVYGELLPGSVGNAQFLCYNTAAATLTQLTAPSGGTGTYTYQWQRSTDGITYGDIGGATSSTYSPGTLTSSYYYRRSVTSATCGTVNSAPVLITVYADLTPGTIGSNQSICYNTSPAAINELTAPTGGTGTYTYQWQSSADNVTWSIITGANSASYAPGALTATVYYRRLVTSGTCGTVNSPSVQIIVYPDLTAGTVGSPQTICQNDAAATLIQLTPATGGTGAYTYQWQSSPDNSVWGDITGAQSVDYDPGVMTVTTYFRRNVTSGTCGTLSTPSVKVTVIPLPVISDQSASVCSGETLSHSILLDNYTNPGDNVTFTWPAPTLSAGLTGGTDRTVATADPLSDVFINVSGGPQTATYYVTPYYAGCTGPVKAIVVTIGSQPVMASDLDRSLCSGMPTGLVLAVAPTSVAATTYNILNITVPAGLVPAAGNKTAASGIADAAYLSGDIFTNETGVDKNVVYRVQPVYGTTCIGDPVDIIVTIHPQPKILPGQKKTVCSSTPVNMEIKLIPVNLPAGTQFSWGMPVVSDGSTQGTAASGVDADPAGIFHITDVLVNYGATPITATYSVTPVSADGCVGNATDVEITINPEPAAPVIDGADTLCIGETTVVYTVPLHSGSSYTWTVPAAVGVKTFDLNSNAIIINAAAVAGSGTISVTETNSYGCTGVAGYFDVLVMGPSPVSPVTGDNSVCALESAGYSVPFNDGSVYTWSLPAGAALVGDPSASAITVVFGTTSGNISVREVNAAGCITDHTPLPVTVRPQPTAVISNSGTICQEDTFPVNISLTGATPWTVIYAINGVNQVPLTINASPYTLTATTAGTYTIVSVADANGCSGTGTGSATVSYYPRPTATISGTTAMCAGGSAVLTISFTGAAPYNFEYSNGSTTTTISNYISSVYTVTVTPAATTTYTLVSMSDSHGCEGTLNGTAVVTVNNPPVLTLVPVNLSCYGNNSGSIGLTVAGTGVPFSYVWTGPDGYTAGVEDISMLAAGYYSVTVTDINGCTATASTTLTQPPVLVLGNTGNIALVCSGDDDGSGSFTPAGGTAPYSFTALLNTTGSTFTSTAATASFTGAGPGTLTVQVTDANGCQATSTITVTEPAPVVVTAVLSLSTEGSHNINCYNGATGTITLSVSGGTSPYTYSWTTADGSGLKPAVANQTGLTAGTYTVTVTDAHGCQATESYTLTQPSALSVTLSADDNIIGTCSTSETQLTAAASGGVELSGGGYSYSWSPAAGLSATNVADPVAKPAATTTYTVIVTDANGCTVTGSVTVEVRPLLVASVTASDMLIGDCAGSSSSLDVTVTGGEGPFTYLWDNAATLSDAMAKNPVATPAVTTTYTVTVTDINGCTATASVTVAVTAPVTVGVTVSDNLIGTCSSSETQLNATAFGGEAPYSYQWDNGTTLSSDIIANPVAKPASTTIYTVTVTDNNGCTATGQVTVNVAPALTVSVTATDNIIGTCPSSLSVLTATVTGGEELTGGGYTYSWSPAAGLNYTNVQSPVAKPAVTTTYTVTVTDRNGCTATGSVTITVNPPLSLTAVATVYAGGYNIRCHGGSDGSIDLTVNGGEGPFAVSWAGPSGFTSTAQDISSLVAGTYNVSVTDANGCTSTTTVVLSEPAQLTMGTTPDVVLSCYGDGNASGSFSVSGGTAPYTITPLGNTSGASLVITGTGMSFTLGSAGEVTAGVTDANGCTTQATIFITEPGELLPGSINGDQEVCFQGDPSLLDQVTAPSGGPGTILFQWERSTDGGGSWNSVSGATMASYDPPAGITVTTLFRRRASSGTCDPVYSNPVTVTVNPLPVASITGAGLVCPGDAAVLRVTITTGESPYNVVLSDGTILAGYISGTDITVNPVIPTVYTISSVTDNNGCSVSAPHLNLTGSATIDIKGVPDIAVQPSDQSVCEGEPAVFTVDAGGTTNPTYQWYYDAGSGPQLMAGETTATLSVTATTVMDGYTYHVIVGGDCPPAVTSDEVTLTVKELPEIATGPSDVTVCAGDDATLTVDAGATTNPVYQWYVNTGSGWNPVTGSRYQGATTNTLTIVSVLELMTGYQYKVRVSGDCLPYVESAAVVLTVTRPTEITQQPVSQTVCEGAPASFTVNAGVTSSPAYQWETSTDGGITWNIIPGATSATYTIASATTAMNNTMYRVVVSGSCGADVTSQVVYLVVNELPEIMTPPADLVLCEGEIGNFTVDAGNTTAAIYTWQISTDNGVNWVDMTESARYFGVATSNLKINGVLRTMTGYQFRVIVAGTCNPPVTSSAATLTVNTRPEITDQPDPASICETESTSFTVAAQGTGLTYLWYVDQGGGLGFEALTDGGVYTGSDSPTLTLTSVPVSFNNYRYRVVVTGSCTPPASSDIVTLNVALTTAITSQPVNQTICEFGAVSFDVAVVGADLTYQWQQYNGTTWTDVTNNGTFMGATTNELTIFGATRSLDQYRYRVIIGSKCSADITSAEAILTVNVSPALTDQPDDVKSCPGSTVSYSVTATGSGLTYQWQVNSGSGFADVSDGAPYSGTTTNTLTISNLTLGMNGYLVRVIVSGTCMPPVYSSYASLSVYAEPVIMTQPADAQVCDGSTVVFYSQVYTTAAGETMRWQVNDGSGWSDLSESGIYQGTQTSQLLIPVATASMDGWYYRLQVTGPCGNYLSDDALLTVNELPDGLVSPSDTLLVCGGVPTQLHGNPTGGSGTYTTHRWFGDVGPLSQFNIENPVFNNSFPGYYKLIYQVTDSKGCIGIDTVVVEVEKPVAMFTADHPSGCQPLTVTFTNSSSGYTSLLWDFGDGQTSTDENPTHIYPNPSSSLLYYTVSLTVTSANGCSSVMTSDITVYPEVMSDFFFSDDEICSGETVTLSSLPGGFKYYWNFGDGEEGLGANVINHTFTNYTTAPVTYNVTLTATSFFGCEGSTTLPIVVYPVPIPGFTATPVSQTMPNSTVTFTNTTNAGTWTWLWKFGDGNTSTDKDPVYTYGAPGTFTVSLLVSNGVCSDAISHSISIFPTPPIADFDSIPSGCKVWTIAPVNTSLYATTYYWEFGDGGVSTAKDPVYTYTTAGVYRVTLTVTGPGGTDSKSQLVSVYQSPLAYFEVSPSTVYVNDEKVRCFNLSEGAVSYIWEFGDGDTSHVADPYHRYTAEGVYEITLHAYSANGCYDTYVLSPAVTVVPFGDLSFATVFRPNQTGEINLDELPTSGDAVNQFFYPPIRETVVGYHLQIFNRWGTLIYESYDINKPWNGYYKHKLCPQGVYVWLVEGKYANGRPFKKVGDITLLH